MTPPGSDIEKAVHYAVLNGSSIDTSSQLGDDQKREQYGQLLNQVDSPQRVAELQLRFEEDKPYFQLCDDEAIASYFSRWNVPIATRRDLDLFSDALAEKVTALAPYDESVRTQLEQRDYRRQLRELPATLSSLEQAVSEYDALKPSFKAVMRYVWEAVALDGFKMREDGRKATEEYKGDISIQPIGNKAVHMKIVLSENDTFELYLNPRYKTQVTVPAKKRRFWFDVKEKVEETDEIGAVEALPMRFFDRHYPKNTDLRHVDGHNYQKEPATFCVKRGKLDSEIFRTQAGCVVDLLKEINMMNPDKYGESFQTYLQIVLNLPKLMNNYANRTRESMQGILQRVSEQSNGSPE